MVHIYGGWRCCKLGRGNKATIYIVGDWVESSFKWRHRHSLGIFFYLVFVFLAFMMNLSVIYINSSRSSSTFNRAGSLTSQLSEGGRHQSLTDQLGPTLAAQLSQDLVKYSETIADRKKLRWRHNKEMLPHPKIPLSSLSSNNQENFCCVFGVLNCPLMGELTRGKSFAPAH